MVITPFDKTKLNKIITLISWSWFILTPEPVIISTDKRVINLEQNLPKEDISLIQRTNNATHKIFPQLELPVNRKKLWKIPDQQTKNCIQKYPMLIF